MLGSPTLVVNRYISRNLANFFSCSPSTRRSSVVFCGCSKSYVIAVASDFSGGCTKLIRGERAFIPQGNCLAFYFRSEEIVVINRQIFLIEAATVLHHHHLHKCSQSCIYKDICIFDVIKFNAFLLGTSCFSQSERIS